jgi:sec-independent protein translocase protein TatA
MEILVVLLIALIVFGPRRIPELGKSVGKGIREFKASLDGLDEDREEADQRIEGGQQAGAGMSSPSTVKAELPPERRG